MMTEQILKLAIFEFFAIAMFYSAFCRMIQLPADTRIGLKTAVMIVGMVSCAGMAGPVVWDYQPTWMGVALIGGWAIYQGLTAPEWVPDKQAVPPLVERRKRDENLSQPPLHT